MKSAVQQGFMRQTYRFRNSTFADFATPSVDNLIDGFTALKGVQYLPNHYARALKSRFAVANLRVGHDVFSQLKSRRLSLWGTTPAILHG